MDYKNMSVDELIEMSLDKQAEIVAIREERTAIKEEIARQNAINSARNKLSDKEKEILGIVVTPAPAVLKAEGM